MVTGSLWLVNPQSLVSYISPAVTQIWGRSIEEFTSFPYPLFFGAYAHEDDLPNLNLDAMRSPGYDKVSLLRSRPIGSLSPFTFFFFFFFAD